MSLWRKVSILGVSGVNALDAVDGAHTIYRRDGLQVSVGNSF